MKQSEEENIIVYYNKNAENFIERTINCDVSKCYAMFLEYLKPGQKNLDLGCGSGERIIGERIFNDYTENDIDEIFNTKNGFKCLYYTITEDVRANRKNEKWLNIVAQKREIFYKEIRTEKAVK